MKLVVNPAKAYTELHSALSNWLVPLILICNTEEANEFVSSVKETMHDDMRIIEENFCTNDMYLMQMAVRMFPNDYMAYTKVAEFIAAMGATLDGNVASGNASTSLSTLNRRCFNALHAYFNPYVTLSMSISRDEVFANIENYERSAMDDVQARALLDRVFHYPNGKVVRYTTPLSELFFGAEQLEGIITELTLEGEDAASFFDIVMGSRNALRNL